MTAARRSRPCVYGCSGPARLWPQGWRCERHAPPPVPKPPFETTLAGRLAAAGKDRIGTPAGDTVVDERAVASGKRQASIRKYREALAAEQERRRRVRDESKWR